MTNLLNNHQPKHFSINFSLNLPSNKIVGEVEHFTTNNKHASYQPRRHKRDLNQNNPYTIEVLAIVDESMQNFHKVIGTDIKEYVLKLLSTTANVFADPTVGNMINVAVVDILSLHESLNASHLLEGTDVDNLLDKFKQFMNEQMSKKLYFDVGLLLTRYTIETNVMKTILF